MNAAQTVSKTFLETVERFKDNVAIRDTRAKEETVVGGQNFSDRFDQVTYTWQEYKKNASDFAKALLHLGKKNVVAIQGANSAHWLFANLGTILSGGISSGVYPTNNEVLSKHVASNSAASVIAIENEEQLKKYAGIESTALKCFVVWNKIRDESVKKAVSQPVYTWDEFIALGKQVPDSALEEKIEGQNPHDVCSLIYTSGTTGLPKAAALTHDNLIWTASTAGRKFSLDNTHKGLSYLPLSHIAAQQLDCIVPITYGYSVNIAPSDALKGNNLKQHIVNTRPTYFLAVPRVWEKFKEAIEQKLEQADVVKKTLFHVGMAVGRWANRTVR
jgi:long-chain-fatty-acid--CoA ligase ACSBG